MSFKLLSFFFIEIYFWTFSCVVYSDTDIVKSMIFYCMFYLCFIPIGNCVHLSAITIDRFVLSNIRSIELILFDVLSNYCIYVS